MVAFLALTKSAINVAGHVLSSRELTIQGNLHIGIDISAFLES